MPVTRIAFVLFHLAPLAIAGAQAKPAGVNRPWVELMLGAGDQAQNCSACVRNGSIGGATAGLAGGLTITPQFGIALLGRAFSEITFEENNNGQSSSYLMVLGQFSPPTASWFTLSVGGGYGRHSGDNASHGAALSTGFALRATGGSPLGLALEVSAIQSLIGHTNGSNGLRTSYRPTLLTVGLGLSLAGPPAE